MPVGCFRHSANCGVNSSSGVPGRAAAICSSVWSPSKSASTVSAYGARNASAGESYRGCSRFHAVTT
ncbi:hypothetical protein C2142_05900 [Streptomyces sp. CB01881]|nr:hypothetical protein C2142_05900 [Streptomyces sp. CB01881]